MYPKKTKKFKTSNIEIFIDFKDFIKHSIKSFKSPRTILIFLQKNFHF